MAGQDHRNERANVTGQPQRFAYSAANPGLGLDLDHFERMVRMQFSMDC
jgi:hypothetical protein